jgi:small subunit ribosomal protein S15
MLTAIQKQQVVEAFQKDAKDTGSTAVQVALLTESINQLQSHFQAHKHDHHSRRGLIRQVNRRRSLLDYLKRTKNEEYKMLIERLGLRR